MNEVKKISIEKISFQKDSNAVYITPLLGISWGEKYDKAMWFGWLWFLFTIKFKK